MKPFIVVSDGFDKQQFNHLCQFNELEVYPESKLAQDNFKKLLPKINGLIIRSATTMNQELIDLAPNLKLIIRAGEGTDNIDKSYCAKKGIKVANTPGANNNSAAEHAIALIFTVLRQTAAAHQTMKEGKWEKNLFTGLELTGKTIGIVGFGRIGQIVAKRLSGFEPKILYFDPITNSSEYQKAKNLEELFEKSDVITLHTPLMKQTENLINATLLQKMKKTAIIVNASRGKIVDEAALFQVLKDKKIRGAGFDVFAQEPLEDQSPLRQLDNIVLTPHLGASTEEAQIRVGEMAVNQIKEFFLNNNLLNEVKA